jgi:uncharacterized protein (TIGR00251 family)
MGALDVEVQADVLRFRVRVKPRASKSKVLGPKAGELEVSVAAAPVDGEANSELVKTLAQALNVGRTTIEIVSGTSGRRKLLLVRGLSESEFYARLKL